MSEVLIRRLRDENATLREQVRQLQSQLLPQFAMPEAWGLTPMEGQMLRALRGACPCILSRDRAMSLLYGMSDNPPALKHLDTLICLLRRRLARAETGIAIQTVPLIGWILTAEGCAIFDAAVAAEQARWPALKRAA